MTTSGENCPVILALFVWSGLVLSWLGDDDDDDMSNDDHACHFRPS